METKPKKQDLTQHASKKYENHQTSKKRKYEDAQFSPPSFETANKKQLKTGLNDFPAKRSMKNQEQIPNQIERQYQNINQRESIRSSLGLDNTEILKALIDDSSPQVQSGDISQDSNLSLDEGIIALSKSVDASGNLIQTQNGESLVAQECLENDDQEIPIKYQQEKITYTKSGLEVIELQEVDQYSSENESFEDKEFTNELFKIIFYNKKPNHTSIIELKLAPPVDQYGLKIDEDFVDCPISFKLTLSGRWSAQTWIDNGDLIRVIGTYNQANNYSLKICDNVEIKQEADIYKLSNDRASMIIVEPHILIPTTQIVKAFPCVRKAYLGQQFKGLSNDVNYPLVLGNVIHAIFQSILEKMDFQNKTLDLIIQQAIKPQLLLLFSLGKTEAEVEADSRRAIKNITEWLDMVLRPNKNQHGILFKNFVAAEQEFNTDTYGIKGNIDATIMIENRFNEKKLTAFEIKTGKYKSSSYRGQVLLYSLLISERFKNSNPDNILLYIMDENVKEGFEYIKQTKLELDSLVIGRNELAKWQKSNTKMYEQFSRQYRPKQEYDENGDVIESKYSPQKYDDKIVYLPDMISNVSECVNCWSKEVCTLNAISIELDKQRVPPQGQFRQFQEIQQKATQTIRQYFKKFIECINLEQSAEKDRQSSKYNINQGREQNLKIFKINPNNFEGVMVTLQKPIEDDKISELSERQFVNLKTENNISFGKGFIVIRGYQHKSNKYFGLEKKDDAEENQKNKIADYNLNRSNDLAKNLTQYIEYIVEFSHFMPSNFTKEALGGKDPKELDWTLELEPFSTFSYSVMRNNILQVSINDKFATMRDSIIYEKPPMIPTIEKIIEMQTRFQNDLAVLNEEQQIAVIKSVLANNYHMVLGTPGSGKTTAIIVLIKILAQLKKRVLVVSFTNSAIDNVLSRLKESGFDKFIRVTNNIASVDERVQSNVKTYKMFDNMKQIQQTIDENYVYGTTCLQMNNNLLSCLKFDYCIMDEASQISEPLAIGPILLADKFIMIGDYYQLNPLVKSMLAEKKGMGLSLFEKLCKQNSKCATVLKKQYRMNNDILELSNNIIYHGVMKHGDPSVAAQKVIFPREVNSMLTWLEEIKKRSVTFLKTDKIIMNLSEKERKRYKYKNFIEAAICAMIIDNFKHCGVDSKKITIITPFLDQCTLLKAHLSMYDVNQVMTIDKAQGIDCDIVIISCTKQTPEKGMLLKDLKRLNVAITRAKKKLILIGTETYLKEIKPLDKIIKKMQAEGWEQELNSFDDQLKSYLPKETKKFLSIDDLGQR